ncbi:bifunctional glutamate N-acetyltransferase/amino-acid acetyltransferase ArgJ [Rhodophyticola sp. CCM32]|uniref:bifunctional glutamate N-acetyltransferase/amino-acid acetyltransferase ArgJ n=1 Tax=Rhodophyticola sp. CCM32 TaxID=2916397 RepID=UPI00107F01FC|nr:bifunctional glutamate N-acetyltransferase/amino-acid acetyltransferase ArgJ [Rhodophyticola sp. CCM32]QBY02108.1 bifunctional glutamate N-acetyltransferase/amino-acid acetyltransferase ArgJ [Rhodophyticola sp. CCM32]
MSSDTDSTPAVSPLAPKNGFPPLPQIAGVRFAAVAAGVKYKARTDVMLAEIAPGASVAGVFTRSATRSAPVRDCEAKLAALGISGAGFAILVNSGNANAFTGAAGEATVQTVCARLAGVMGLPPAHVFTASTGVIGEPLPPEKITDAIAALNDTLSPDGAEAAARAIMTTDTFAKGAAATAQIGDTQVSLAGFAKGSGMIAPDMATMLGYIFTDAAIDQPVLQAMLQDLTGRSFNAITVDSDTSTSDTVMCVATGAAGHARITSADSADARAFAAALEAVMKDLALQIVRDGEGATKLVEVQVTGADSTDDAQKVARAIANSPLVKTAIAGEDPNWGRVVMAVGKSGAEADRDLLSIRFGDIPVAENGWVAPGYHEQAGAAYMKAQELLIAVDLGLGSGHATVWTCDLTHGYITINADYRS